RLLADDLLVAGGRRRRGRARAELGEELPHRRGGPGAPAVTGGTVDGAGVVARPVERGPDDGVSGPASGAGGDDVRQASVGRLGRVLRGAAVGPDEGVAQFPSQ